MDDATIDLWVYGLPKAKPLHIISLLGRKPHSFSEFAYYPFRSSTEQGSEPTFQEWLDRRYGSRFMVHEFPTTDSQGLPADLQPRIASCVVALLGEGNVVLVVDSAGAERTSRLCEALGSHPLTSAAA